MTQTLQCASRNFRKPSVQDRFTRPELINLMLIFRQP